MWMKQISKIIFQKYKLGYIAICFEIVLLKHKIKVVSDTQEQ